MGHSDLARRISVGRGFAFESCICFIFGKCGGRDDDRGSFMGGADGHDWEVGSRLVNSRGAISTCLCDALTSSRAGET